MGKPEIDSKANTQQEDKGAATTPGQDASHDGTQEAGGVTPADPSAEPEVADPPARESRSQAKNRWHREGIAGQVELRREEVRREAKAAGMARHEAVDRSWEVAFAEFPPSGARPTDSPPLAEAPPDPPPDASPDVSDQVVGLGDIPGDWPTLPPNASLAAEVAWVQANRLRVVEGRTVILSKALSPAPSHAALGWLETSILFPAKFADVAVKATASQEDDQAATRRERRAVEEVRALLAEMLPDGSICTTCGQQVKQVDP